LYTVLDRYGSSAELTEALYLFLISWYVYRATYYEHVLPRGGRWILLDELVKEQFMLRGLNAEKLFDEFKDVLQALKFSSKEIDLLIKMIERKYFRQLSELLKSRLSKLVEKDYELIESFSAHLFYVEGGRKHVDYGIFNRLKAILKEDFGRLYRGLVGSGLVLIHGYRSITPRKRILDHIGVLVPPWSFERLKKVFGEYLAKQEAEAKRIICELEEREVCPICGKPLLEGESFTTLFSFRIHHPRCYEEWKSKTYQILSSLPKTYVEVERKLIAEFQALNSIKGEYLCEVPVSSEVKFHPYIGMKRIDLVIRTENIDWIIEVEEVLNYTAIGQVLVYSILWGITHPGRQIIRGIVVDSSPDRDLVRAAKILGIKVFSRA